MKNLLHLFFGIVGLICAICALIVISFYPVNAIQVIGLILLALFGISMVMIFGYLVVTHYRENRDYDLAAKEQMQIDYEYGYYGL